MHGHQRLFLLLSAFTACSGAKDDDTSSAADDSSSAADCSGATTDMEAVVCAADALLASLSSADQDAITYEWTDAEARTTWSNLPAVPRNGLALGDLSEESRALAMALWAAALTEDGYAELLGVLAADDYHADGDETDEYGADFYSVAIIGAPSVDGSWMMQIGGHHMAYNLTYIAGEGFPVPHHMGVEPREPFSLDGETYDPLGSEQDAFLALFGSLSETGLAEAYLDGEVYPDILMGPDEGSGTLPTTYPTGEDRAGLLVSSLSADQQALVLAVMDEWLADYPDNTEAALRADYTTEAALADTYIAWAGDQTAGLDPSEAGTYMRIDGPRLWIEFIYNAVGDAPTHYHCMFRDKAMDYGGSL